MLSYRLIHGVPTALLPLDPSDSPEVTDLYTTPHTNPDTDTFFKLHPHLSARKANTSELHVMTLGGRSRCPHCACIIAWYDLVPVFSWLFLKGHCRTCHQPISSLYPLTELLTALIGTYAYFGLPPTYWLGYGLFFSALIISVRSDLECMLISRLATIYLVPLAFFLSSCNLLPIPLNHSVLGALVGYGALWAVATLFTRFTGKQGMGLGDFDLLCFIGAFTGPIGVWISILVGSLTGSGIGLCYLLAQGRAFNTKIPFGPFLALGATLFIFFAPTLTTLLIGFPIYLIPE